MAVLSVVALRQPNPSEWDRFLATLARRVPLDPIKTGVFGRTQTELFLTLVPKPVWDDREMGRVRELSSLWSQLPHDLHQPNGRSLTSDEIYVVESVREVLTMTASRIRYGGKFTVEARTIADQLLLELLDCPVPYIRQSAISALSYSEQYDNPYVLARVQAMTSDPDAEVARFAKLKLGQHAAFGTRANPRQGTVKHEDFANP